MTFIDHPNSSGVGNLWGQASTVRQNWQFGVKSASFEAWYEQHCVNWLKLTYFLCYIRHMSWFMRDFLTSRVCKKSKRLNSKDASPFMLWIFLFVFEAYSGGLEVFFHSHYMSCHFTQSLSTNAAHVRSKTWKCNPSFCFTYVEWTSLEYLRARKSPVSSLSGEYETWKFMSSHNTISMNSRQAVETGCLLGILRQSSISLSMSTVTVCCHQSFHIQRAARRKSQPWQRVCH